MKIKQTTHLLIMDCTKEERALWKIISENCPWAYFQFGASEISVKIGDEELVDLLAEARHLGLSC